MDIWEDSHACQTMRKIKQRFSMEDSMSLHPEEPGRGSAAVDPIITQHDDDYISYRVLLHYSKGGKINVLLLLLPHSASGLTNDLTDPCQPPDREGDRRNVSLCLCRSMNRLLPQQTTFKAVWLCYCNSIMPGINYLLNILWDYHEFLQEK